MTPSTGRVKPHANKKNGSSFGILVKILVAMMVFLSAVFISYGLLKNGVENSNPPPGLEGSGGGGEGLEDTVPASTQGEDGGLIFNNIFINDIPVGGLSKDEAAALLAERIQAPLDGQQIEFTYEETGRQEAFTLFKAQYDISQAAEEAWNYGRSGTDRENEAILKRLKNNPHKIEAPYSYSQEALAAVLAELEAACHKAPTEPSFERINGQFVVGKSAPGSKMDVEAVAASLLTVLDSRRSGKVNVVMVEELPQYKEEEFAKATNLLGTYTSSYSTSSANRINNVELAASKINNRVVMPGEVFSTNEAFGSRNDKNGYRMAGTIINGKLEDGVGGGICQVSSTLYMAMLNAEMEIVERTNHSLKVSYMPWAYDATLSEGYIDLKLKNATDYPVTIESIVNNKKLTINVYGFENRPAGRTISFESVLVSSTPPPAEQIVQDPNLPLDKRVVDTPAQTGHKYQLYKYVYQDSKLVGKELVNTSVYKAVKGIVRVGTGPEEASPEGTPNESPADIAASPTPNQNTPPDSGGQAQDEAVTTPAPPPESSAPPAEQQSSTPGPSQESGSELADPGPVIEDSPQE